MSYQHVRRLSLVREEFVAAYVAVAYLSQTWAELSHLPLTRDVRLSHVRTALSNLEATYTIRVFAEFEAVLNEYLTTTHPRLRVPRTAEALINRTALRARIPDPLRDRAHLAREYRNSLVHRRMTVASVLGFDTALAALNRFLAAIP